YALSRIQSKTNTLIFVHHMRGPLIELTKHNHMVTQLGNSTQHSEQLQLRGKGGHPSHERFWFRFSELHEDMWCLSCRWYSGPDLYLHGVAELSSPCVWWSWRCCGSGGTLVAFK
ncbi:hypothetical protein XENORESO_019766, partial [Xenotaenia resolanae]